MREAYDNLWDYYDRNKVDAVILTTSAVIKKDGSLVMSASARIPGIEYPLGFYVAAGGNFPYLLKECNYKPSGYNLFTSAAKDKVNILTMPVKRHFKENSKLDFVVNQAILVNEIVEVEGYNRVISMTPGCGFGNLSWDMEVKPELDKIWDSRYTVLIR